MIGGPCKIESGLKIFMIGGPCKIESGLKTKILSDRRMRVGEIDFETSSFYRE
uniref:AlNc14C47G3788 protein n=1 Tax=Albugo laibachii Nc14 TaxID=890382 RepID=F0WAS4_9STRA|nr:AlNc14C47G3788 [Albugo laibachii Nc14]|eukprot:CCA18246.1 AlNc14C47G3788 [Albugo laibachii Nc14]